MAKTQLQCSLLFLLRDDEILLAMKKRGFGQGHYNGVGGKVEPEETVEQTCIRECQEEIGVTPLAVQKVAEHDFRMQTGPNMYVHAFTTREWEGEPTETDEMAPQWFKLADIPYDHMWQDDIFWLPAVLLGHQLKTQFTFDDQDHMVDTYIQIVSGL